MTLETLTALRRRSADPTPFIERRADTIVWIGVVVLGIIAWVVGV